MEINVPVSNIIEHKGNQVHSVQPTATVLDAVRFMNQKKIGALLVLHNNKPVGMFTERDVLVRIVDVGRDPQTTLVSDVMTSKLIVIKPSTTIEDAMFIITQKRCRHLPVVEDDKLLGMISIGDLMRWIVREHKIYIDHLLDYISGRYPA
jgi:CBS domain-containing protein